MACVNVTTNTQGMPYLQTTNVTVSTSAVDFSLGFRRIQPVGLFAVRISNAIPDGTTGTLPVSLSLNGTSRPLSFFGGDAVTAADLPGTGVILVFNDRYNNILQLIMAQPSAAAASTGETTTANP